MIGRIHGRLIGREGSTVELLTRGGVGYELSIPTTLLNRLPALGDEVEMYTSLVVKDDALELFGFGTARERELFRRLQSASGVGPRLAIAILGSLPSGRIVSAIRGKDHAVLQTVSGVGRKTAERIALELTDKLDDLAAEDDVAASSSAGTAAVQALRSLGYGQVESREAVARASAGLDGGEAEPEQLIRVALRWL